MPSRGPGAYPLTTHPHIRRHSTGTTYQYRGIPRPIPTNRLTNQTQPQVPLSTTKDRTRTTRRRRGENASRGRGVGGGRQKHKNQKHRHRPALELLCTCHSAARAAPSDLDAILDSVPRLIPSSSCFLPRPGEGGGATQAPTIGWKTCTGRGSLDLFLVPGPDPPPGTAAAARPATS